MISIAFVIDTIESPTAGTEKQLLLMLNHLNREKVTPYLCVLRSSPWLREEFTESELFDAEIPSFLRPTTPFKLWRLAQFFREKNTTIVQTHFRDGSIAGILAARLAGVNVIIGTRRNQGYWYSPLELIVQKFLNRSTTAFIANSNSTKHYAVASEGIAEAKIQVIYNAIDLERFQHPTNETRNSTRSRLGLSAKTPVIGIVANLRPVKRIDIFLLAARRVMETLPNAKFVVIGEGPEHHALTSLAENMGLNSSVLFLGSRVDAPDLLPSLDIAVLSSESESFSNSLLEYLAAGLPVVTTDVGGAREVIDNGVNGYIVPVRDHQTLAERILEILISGETDMGTIGRTIVMERFSISTMLNLTEGLYLSLIEGEACDQSLNN